jgi:hypothetical protein
MNDGDPEGSAPPAGGLTDVFFGGRKPADHPLPTAAFNCPTGTCDSKACSDIPRNQAYNIQPFSRPHVERNACNRCPTSPPPLVEIKSRSWFQRPATALIDVEGNLWGIDSSVTAPKFHGDPGWFRRDGNSATYRVQKAARANAGGWQCRYWEGALDDTSYDLGTYDYADAPGVLRALGRATLGSSIDNLHDDMDVVPHFANPRYAPNLTQKF